MDRSISSRILGRIGQIQAGEAATAFLMLAYSFLAMASYNAIKPITRSKFIDSLGADNLPYVQLAAGLLIGMIMVAYSWLMARLPRRWSLPIVQVGIVGLLLAFWFLFRVGGTWVPVAFYVTGLILGILLISQFWTLANLVYDPRQAKRLFGFIGAGAPLGGIAGSILTVRYVKQIGSVNILLVSAVLMALCVLIVAAIIFREQLSGLAAPAEGAKEETKAQGWQGLDLLRNSKHLQIIALVISFAAIGAAIIEQQLNMAAAAAHSQESAIAGLLAVIQAWTSAISFLVQILLTSRIHRFLGIGFALLILPVSLGSTAMVMLMVASLWAPGLARVLDQSLRYTVDKTSREILFMPLPSDIKLQAKPFVDVTVDRFAKGFGALILLLLIKPWGLHLNWQQLSYASLTMMALWIVMALRARRAYVEAFRRSIGNRQVKPAEIRLEVADLSMLEVLVGELSNLDERRVLYAIEVLESLGKKNLIPHLLLLHESSSVRLRALSVLDGSSPETAARWLPSIKRLLTDRDPEVRAGAVGALANIQAVDAVELVRPSLADSNPRIAMTAAMVLARGGTAEDSAAAECVLEKLRTDPRDTTVEVRKELATLLRHIPDMRFRRLLIPLLTDSSLEVAQEALRSVRQLGDSDCMFVPVLISLLRHPRLRQTVRDLLVGYGEAALAALGHFLLDQGESPAVRRNIPSVIARIPCSRAADLLLGALADPDRQLRFEAIAGLETMRRRQPALSFRREPVEALVLSECQQSAYCATLRHNCFGGRMPDRTQLLERTLAEKEIRRIDRIFRLLGLIFSRQDIVAAQWSIERSGPARARALEYLDNLLPGTLRKRVLPVLEGEHAGTTTLPGKSNFPAGEATEANSLRPLIRDPDPVLSAAAIQFVCEARKRQYQKDLEMLIATRNHGEWWVSEEASWTLGTFRLIEDGLSEPLAEPLPAVEVAARLGRLPLFASVSSDELIRVACAGRHVRHQHNTVIYREGTTAEDIQFLVQGRAILRWPSGIEQSVEAPAPLSFQEVLEDRPMAAKVRAATPCMCLSFSLAEWQVLMAESTGLVQGLLRMLCVSIPERIADLVVRRAGVPSRLEGTASLDPIAKATLLEALPVFSQVSREEMLALTGIASEVNAVRGDQIFTEADPPALHLLISGSISLESTDGDSAVSASPGDAVGLYQMLAGIPLVRQGRCLEDARFLRVEREDLLNLLMQRPDLQRQLLGSLFRGSQFPL
ncbi:MAG TPA: Npt1/Npt2 family nucleotide transporter [Terriglobales bacterium]|nr:Npt1/Npt2 family nucleotide transporter [Terriglobales bacterium]